MSAAESGPFGQFFRHHDNDHTNPVHVEVEDTGMTVVDRLSHDHEDHTEPDVVGISGETSVQRHEDAERTAFAIERLQEGYSQVMDLMTNVREHMQSQSERAERALTTLETMSESLANVPEVTRSHTFMVQTLRDHLGSQYDASERLANALGDLSRTTEQREEAMNTMNHQLNSHLRTTNQMIDTMSTVNGSMGNVKVANENNTAVLRGLLTQAKLSDERTADLVQSNRKHLTALCVVSWLLGVAAIVVAVMN